MAAPKGNKNAVGNIGGGRPYKYETPEEMEISINEYFTKCQEAKSYPSVTGLALALGFADRKSIYEYRDNRIEFNKLIKKALTFVEMHYELRLNTTSPTGAIFALKNMGWIDRLDHKVDSEVRITEVEYDLPPTEE